MIYSFKPMSEEEINSFNLMEDGIYDFEVIRSNRKISKQGNAMAELQLNVWSNEGKIHIIYDYLVFSEVPLNIKKIKHFCDSTGLKEEYKNGVLPEDLSRLSGKVKISTKDKQPNPKGGFYEAKNVVFDYIEGKEEDREFTF